MLSVDSKRFSSALHRISHSFRRRRQIPAPYTFPGSGEDGAWGVQRREARARRAVHGPMVRPQLGHFFLLGAAGERSAPGSTGAPQAASWLPDGIAG